VLAQLTRQSTPMLAESLETVATTIDCTEVSIGEGGTWLNNTEIALRLGPKAGDPPPPAQLKSVNAATAIKPKSAAPG
jgi:hypothetical protein